MKPFQLKQHLTNAHPQLKDRNRSFFEVKLSSLKRMKMDETGTYQQTNISIVKASYVIAFQGAKAKKPHMVGESLMKPCIVDSVRLVLGEESSQKMKQISLSNNTIKNRIAEMSENIKENVVSKVMSSPSFFLQIYESTDVTNIAQLHAFSRYITDKGLEEKFLFCRPLEMTRKAVDVVAVVADFFEESGLSWNKLEGVCTDGGPNMLGSRSGFIALVK
ncbi:protein FAM200C-like [Palaemon carinicauda]|uniref:protein FAM200C-like n=1 Tax=Palaemon carinicauda TaxID=392227 RepID=UPI0035B5D664